MESEFDFCVLGSANIDKSLYVPHIPVEGETLNAHKLFVCNGGKGANQGMAMSKIGGRTIFAGQLGIDKLGEELIKEMKAANVCMDYINVVTEVESGQAIIMLDNDGNNSIIIYGGANMYYNTPYTLPTKFQEAIDKCKIVLLQMEIPQEINLLAAKYAKSKGKLVVLDCGGRDEKLKDEFVNNLDFISPNEVVLCILRQVEMEKIFGEEHINLSDLESKCNALKSKFPNLKILLKLGKYGCAYSDSKRYITCPSVSQINPKVLEDHKIVDTVGAGDCFTATFFYKYLQKVKDNKEDDQYIRDCMIFANSSAFLCITKHGAMPSMPIESEVQDLIKNYSLV